MRTLLSAACVLGLAAIFGWSEPGPVSARPVTSDEVQLVSEEEADNPGGPLGAKYAKTKKNAKTGGGKKK